MSLADWQREFQRQELDRFFSEDIPMFGKPYWKLTYIEKGRLYWAHVERDSEYFNLYGITADATSSVARCIFDLGASLKAKQHHGAKLAGELKKKQGEETRSKVLAECESLKAQGKSPHEFAGIIEQRGWISASQVRRIVAEEKTRIG